MGERSGCHNNLHVKIICYARKVSFSIGSFFKTFQKNKNHIGHLLYECPFKQENSRWNSCIPLDKYFDKGVVKIQQGRAVDLKEIEKHA